MSTKKNPGLGARMGSVEAALAVSRVEAPSVSRPPDSVVPLSVRLPRPIHDALRKIAYDRRVSIHSLILEGIVTVIKEKG